jgi:tetratricopeptide (TPR) repeat protein
MARRKSNKKQDETLVDLVEVKESAQDFLESHQKLVLGIGLVLIVLFGGYLAYKYAYMAPREKNAAEQVFKAQQQFERDSFALALENPGEGYEGFLDIIDNYGGTKIANTAKYYAGISYLNLGRFDDAISYLESFKPSGELLPITKYGALGDAFAESNDFDKAIQMYKKATQVKGNDFLTPYYLKKLGLLQKRQGNDKAASDAFNRITEEFGSSDIAKEVEQFQ